MHGAAKLPDKGHNREQKGDEKSKKVEKGLERGRKWTRKGQKSDRKGQKSYRKTRGKGHKGGKYRGLKVVRKGTERLQMNRKGAEKWPPHISVRFSESNI
jgi:hypothetical protein